MVSRKELYAEKAAEYAAKAREATDPEAKDLYRKLAERWQVLASEVEGEPYFMS